MRDIVAAVASYPTVEMGAASLGVTAPELLGWLVEGLQPDAEALYQELARDVAKAEAKARGELYRAAREAAEEKLDGGKLFDLLKWSHRTGASDSVLTRAIDSLGSAADKNRRLEAMVRQRHPELVRLLARCGVRLVSLDQPPLPGVE